MEIIEERECKYKNCKRMFKPKRKWAEFCRPKCRQCHHYDERQELIKLGKEQRDKNITTP